MAVRPMFFDENSSVTFLHKHSRLRSSLVIRVDLSQAVSKIPDPRQASNATRYGLSDVILGAFSVFFMQCESFLEHQRQMQSRRGKDNAQSLFGLGAIPSSPQIRTLLDEVEAVGLFEVFFKVYAALRRGGCSLISSGMDICWSHSMAQSISSRRRFTVSAVRVGLTRIAASPTFIAPFCP